MFIILTASRHTYFKQIYGFVLPRKLLHSTAHVAFASRHNSSNSRRRRKTIGGGGGLVLQRILYNILWMISHLSFSDGSETTQTAVPVMISVVLAGMIITMMVSVINDWKGKTQLCLRCMCANCIFVCHGDDWILGTSKVPGSRPWAPALDKSGSTACRMLMAYIYV